MQTIFKSRPNIKVVIEVDAKAMMYARNFFVRSFGLKK
jgi:hypothetical protein